MASSGFVGEEIRVESADVVYTESDIISYYNYNDSYIRGNIVVPTTERLVFKTGRQLPKTGLLLVGWGGNNGTTLTAGILANKHGVTWHTKEGLNHPNYLGSICKSATMRIGVNDRNMPVHTGLGSVVPLLNPNDLEIWGWDISGVNMGDAMRRAKVLDWDLQRKLYDELQQMVPWPSIYIPEWIAANQSDRADNTVRGSKKELVSIIRQNIKDFKASKQLDKVVVLWTANTEKFAVIKQGINDTADNLLRSIDENHDNISPSTLFAVSSILEGCTYINGSPQNTFVPGCIELAERYQVLIAGDDFKSGQTKIKSVLSDFLINSGLKLQSVVSYNHLGNNDGKNLSAPETFRSKEISKSGVIDDVVNANRMMYKEGEHPDHCVVIKYVPYVGDSKRAMDEYISEIFMGGRNTIAIHNTCEDSLLAAPIILDLVILAELCTRIQVRREKDEEFTRMHPVLSILSYLLKSPLVPPGSPVVHMLFPQRFAITNLIRALVGLPPETFMLLEHKVPTLRMGKSVIA
jgi:myo-inositol-1-phosphate synthase